MNLRYWKPFRLLLTCISYLLACTASLLNTLDKAIGDYLYPKSDLKMGLSGTSIQITVKRKQVIDGGFEKAAIHNLNKSLNDGIEKLFDDGFPE